MKQQRRALFWMLNIPAASAVLLMLLFCPTASWAVCADNPARGIICKRDQRNLLNPQYVLNDEEQQIVRQCYEPRFELFRCENNSPSRYTDQQQQWWTNT